MIRSNGCRASRRSASGSVAAEATVALLVLDLAWYAVLLVAEFVRPRPRYDARRWATVFPMGMTAVATLSVAADVDVPWLETPGEVLLWISVAAWSAVAAGAGGAAVCAQAAGAARMAVPAMRPARKADERMMVVMG